MSKRRKTAIQYLSAYIAIILCFIIIIPLLCIKIFPSLTESAPAPGIYNGTLPDSVDIYITEKKRFKTVDFETYIEGVVASEMPSNFDFEALKAQAVASRTYALGRILSGAELCDTVHCQVYRSDNIPAKVSRAVNSTKGQVLLYDGKLASQALYFSSSAGDTENAQDVFTNTYPYLVSVSSDEEPGATHKKEVSAMSLKAFRSQLKASLPELDFGSIKKSNIKILSHTKGGRVATIKVGKQTLSGADIRNAFNLYSTRFSIKVTSNQITITSSGSGHGVGMSQYGANGLAKKGKTYQEILAHYYQGTTVGQ